MNRIKDILKKSPQREDAQPMNIIYREDILFEDKTNENMPNKFDEVIQKILDKQRALYKKPKKRIRVIEDEDITKEQIVAPPKEKTKKPSTVILEKEREPEREPEPEPEPEKFVESAEEETDFDEISQIINYIRRNKQGRIPHIENSYYLTNRKRFVEFVKRMFGKYKEELAAITKPASCDTISSEKKLSLLVHQKLITDYLNMYTPYRGLLLFHGLGSGKTCSSIAIAENFKNPNKQVIVMTPASLKPNFIKEIKKCGDFVYRLNNNWIWQPYSKLKNHADRLEHEMYLSKGYIQNNGGAWVIDRESNGRTTTKKNREAINSRARHTLDEQLNEMISKRYRHISYNGIRMSHLSNLSDGFTRNPFDNKVIIVDEAHKFISPIVNKIRDSSKSRKKSETSLGVALNMYQFLLSAKNARIILLTGTPIVNYPNETAVLFNILRGYIHTYEMTVRVRSSARITNDSLMKMFYDSEISKQVDYFYYSPSDSILTITRNPFHFLNTKSSKGNYSGVRLDREDTEGVDMDDGEFIKAVSAELKKLEIDVERIEQRDYKNLPDSLDSFMTRFYSGVNMINKEQLSNRLVGLTSYFSGTPELLPRYKKEENYHVVRVPMSTYQADQYARERLYELKAEKTSRMKSAKDEFAEQPSSYKIFSRLYCNFAMPEELERPKPDRYPVNDTDKKEKKGGAGDDGDEEEAVSEADIEAGVDEKAETEAEETESETEAKAEPKEIPLPEKKPKRKYVIKQKKEDSSNVVLEKQKEKWTFKYSRKPKEAKEHQTEGEEKSEFKDAEEHDADEIFEEDLTYIKRVAATLRELEMRGNEYFSAEGLEKYSPKFLRIIQNITNPQNEGLHLVYSQFRTMEGIGIFSLALNYNGFAEFKIAKDPATNRWRLNITEEDMAKPKYALYTGKESKEVKEIIMNIYNGFFDLVPPELVPVLRDIAPNNNMGEIIKVFMITASGAEGLDLKNTRFVHLMEPFWNFVRVEQVIGRAVRICSHKNLPEEYKTVDAFIYVSVFSEEQIQALTAKSSKKTGKTVSKDLLLVMSKDTSRLNDNVPITTDENLYEISMRKEEAISQLIKTIKETSIDCTVYPSNAVEGLQCFMPDAPSLEYSYNPNLEKDMMVSLKKAV
jgi:hypothetical protein